MSFLDFFYQCFFIPKPHFTETELPDQTGRVLIVTGGYAGVGKELCKILYSKNGTVYVAGRSQAKADAAIAEIKQAFPSSDGKLEFLHLDLADLPSIKASADDFLKREQRLDVLTNNAGVMVPPAGSKTAQGYELQAGTNVLGPYLFTQYLTPTLQKTAASSPSGSVRVTWAASLATSFAPTNGVVWDEKNGGGVKAHGKPQIDYAQSKACNVLLAHQYQKVYGKDGVVSNAWNPGNLKSELQRHQTGLSKVITPALLYPTKMGAYSELFAGWSEEAGREENWNKYVGPWGRFVKVRKDLAEGKEAQKLWDWCEGETAKYK
jgi:retinol dehydrogenase 12